MVGSIKSKEDEEQRKRKTGLVGLEGNFLIPGFDLRLSDRSCGFRGGCSIPWFVIKFLERFSVVLVVVPTVLYCSAVA